MPETRTEPNVQLLWWSGCPSWERALAMLREQMTVAGLDPDRMEIIEVTDDAQAARLDFTGSPTIRVGGVDLQRPATDEATRLACRVYRRRDGSISPLPDPEDILEALTADQR